ncbi:hypothetical protein WJX84_004335 [Apatococcus fuscideae]|uniref:Inhibitor of growth protein N-terminal histone-binding domain-containing protein n=1 Tax=Apatococcus fuscideae TaxID=2026836 RepID=A0AAW1SXK2_9CHLO
MGHHLQEYVESVADLPAELQRSFKLLQELDQKAQTLQEEVDTEVEQRLSASGPPAGDARADGEPPAKRARSNTSAIPTAISSNTQSKLDTIMQLCEEKVNVAQQIYDLVDQRILRLDRNLRSFDTELIQERRHLELPDDPTAAAAALEAAEPKHKQRKPRKSGSSQLPAPPWAPGPGPPALEPDSGIPAAVDLGEPVKATDEESARVLVPDLFLHSYTQDDPAGLHSDMEGQGEDPCEHAVDAWEVQREDRQRHIPKYHSRRSPVLGQRGMVASSQPLASEV